MFFNIPEAIFQTRRLAYAITDLNFKVVQIGGLTDLITKPGQVWQGESLLTLVPEFVSQEEVLSSVLGGTISCFELPMVNRKSSFGQTLYRNLSLGPYLDEHQRISGLLYIISDVTDIGILEQQLSQRSNELQLLQRTQNKQNLELTAANAELQHLDEMKTIFVSVAAHELRTPLSIIKGYILMLLQKNELFLSEDEQNTYLEAVDRNVNRLQSIIDNLLDIARIESGRLALTLKPTDLTLIIKETILDLNLKLKSKNQHIQFDGDQFIARALCDPLRTSQILENLLSNAHKYTQEGGSITVSLTEAEAEGFFQIAVADTGIGIAPDDQQKLFERFFRGKNVRDVAATGTGLGLSITRSLIEMHGGKIWFESKLGQGSTFYFTLPSDD